MLYLDMDHLGVRVHGLILAAMLLLPIAACGANEHPAALRDIVPGGPRDSGAVITLPRDGSSGVSNDAAGAVVEPPDPLADDLAKKCNGKPPFEAMLCYANEEGHPANSAIYRNMDVRNGVAFKYAIDPTHQKFAFVAGFQGSEWRLTIAAPAGQELLPGKYSTDVGADLGFSWDTGQCPAAQSATFDIYALAWDVADTPTTAEIDFRHHCGDLSTPVLSAKVRVNSSRP